VLIHPDKCKHEKAAEAFQVLAKAYADTKDPAYQDKYKDVVLEAKANVRKRIEKENKEREKKGASHLGSGHLPSFPPRAARVPTNFVLADLTSLFPLISQGGGET